MCIAIEHQKITSNASATCTAHGNNIILILLLSVWIHDRLTYMYIVNVLWSNLSREATEAILTIASRSTLVHCTKSEAE